MVEEPQVKRLKLSTDFDAKLFCGRLNATKPHLLEVCGQFLDVVKDGNCGAIGEFCKISNNGEELLQWLTQAGQLLNRNYKHLPTPPVVLKPVEVQMLVECVDRILTPIVAAASDDSDGNIRELSCYLPFAIRMARGIISSAERMRAVYRQMLPAMPTSYILEAINLLITMTLLGPDVTKELLELLDFTHPAMQHNNNTSTAAKGGAEGRSVKEKWEIGNAMLRLTIALLLNADESTVERLVSARGFIHSVLADIYFSPPTVAIQLLSVLSEKVVHSKSLRKTTKVKVFNSAALMCISSLYIYTGKFHERQERKRLAEMVLEGTQWIELSGDLKFNVPSTRNEEVVEVRRAAHEFMLDLCCSISHGIVFFDKKFLLSDADDAEDKDEADDADQEESESVKLNRNITLTYFLKNLIISKLVVLPEVRRLISEIVRAAADLNIHLFESLKPYMMSRDDSHWSTVSRMASELLSARVSRDSLWRNITDATHMKAFGLEKLLQRRSAVLQAVACPQPIIEAYFNGALRSNSWGHMVVGLNLLASVSNRLIVMWNCCNEENKDVLKRVCSDLPDAQLVIDMWAKLVQKLKSAGTIDDYKACWNALSGCSVSFLMFSHVAPSTLGHGCLDKCLQDLHSICEATKFPIDKNDQRMLRTNVTVALTKTVTDFSSLFRKSKGSKSVFELLLTTLTDDQQQRGYQLSLVGEFLGRNCFLRPFARDLVIWLSVITNKQFLEELFRTALSNPYPYLMKSSSKSHSVKDLMQSALASDVDIDSASGGDSQNELDSQANLLLTVCIDVMLKKIFSSDTQLQAEVGKVVALVGSCDGGSAADQSELWLAVRTQLGEEIDLPKRFLKALKNKFEQEIDSLGANSQRQSVYDVTAQLLYGFERTIDATSLVNWTKVKQIWEKLIEWTLASTLEQPDRDISLELLNQLVFLVSHSSILQKWGDKRDIFEGCLIQRQSAYLTEAKNVVNTNEAKTDETAEIPAEEPIKLSEKYMDLLRRCSGAIEDKKDRKALKRDLRRSWDKMVLVVLKNHYKDALVIKLMADALPVMFSEEKKDEDLDGTEHANESGLQRLTDMVLAHSEFGTVMIDTASSTAKSALVSLLLSICLIGTEANSFPMRSSCIPLLLSCYGATISSTDQMLLAILELCERNTDVDFSCYSPLLWGKRAAQHYSSLKLLGPSLWARPTVDEVLDIIDSDQMLKSAIHIPLELPLLPDPKKLLSGVGMVAESGMTQYDPRFVLPLMISLMDPSQVINCKKVVDKNVMGLAVATLSCRNRDLRGIGYMMLTRFRKLVKTSEKFSSRPQIVCFLNALKEGVTEECQRVPCVVTAFLVKSAQILVNPDHQLYKVITSFTTLKPAFDLENIPEFYKLFNSGSLSDHHAERKWMLDLMSEGLRDPRDYRIYEKRYAFKLLLAYYQCSLASPDEKRVIMRLLKQACLMKSAMVDLCKNYNLIGWIESLICSQMTLKSSRTTRISAEIFDLSELLVVIWDCTKKVKEDRGVKEETDEVSAVVELPKYFICSYMTTVLTVVRCYCKDPTNSLDTDEKEMDSLVNRLRLIRESLTEDS